MFQNKLSEAGKNFEREQIKGFNRQNRVSLFCNFTYLIGFAAILSVIFYLISIKSISVAEVATVLTVVISIYDSMDELMNFHVARMAENMSGLWSMYEIMQLSTADGAQELQGEGYEIQMDNVSFSYPDAETQALQNVSLHLKNGETVAIVGENGSGKTTLSKVLCGLYAPTSGEIRVNGQPGEVIKRSSLMQRVSAVFQDFNRYPMTVRENIRISDVRKQEKEGELDRLSRLSGIYEKVMSEDAGYDTLLSKEFGGTDWSGGLWQRLAIARSNYKDSSLLVFDEPTAAIDPLEEIDIMEKMMSNCQGKTAVLVTHRIGAARLADRVIVMAHGKICETGTHEELLSRGGEYARMFECQKQWYV